MGMSYAPSGYQTATQKANASNFFGTVKKPLGPPVPVPNYVMKPNTSTVVNNKRYAGPTTSTRPARSAPAVSAPVYSGGGSSYGGGALGATGDGAVAEQVAAPAPEPVADTYAAWKARGGQIGDSAFAAQDASAQADYDSLMAQLTQQNTNYQTGFQDNLRNLGWEWDPSKGQDYSQGAWNQDDELGAYGNAFHNLQNDYSGRGLLDSSFYQNGQNDLSARFEKQRTGALSDLAQQQAAYKQSTADASSSKTNAQNRALAEAYSRYAAGFGA